MIFLILLLLPTVALAQAPRTPPPCTGYAAPNGSGSSCTDASPCTIATWLGQKAAPGGVLCLKDGHYRGDQQMLQLSAKSGTQASPITVMAMNDGAVLIDGEHQLRPLDCNASYVTVQGVNVKNGVDTTAAIRGQHCTVQRVVAWTEAPQDGANENTWDVGGAHNVLEDIAGWGYSRKILAVGARGGNGPNTVTRAWLEHNGSPQGAAQGNPTETAEIGYNQSNVTFQNVIARRNILSATTEPEAAHHIFSTHGSALLGSLAYVLSTDNYDTNTLLNVTPEAGSHAGSGFVTSNTTVQDVLLIADPAHGGIRGMQIDGGQGSTGNVARRIIAVAPQGGGVCGGSGWSCTEIYGGTSLSQALGQKTIAEVAPGLCYEVVNRQVTTTPLWPWKMQARIQAALASARMPQKNVTEHATRAMGEIPPQCVRSGDPGPGPGPTPPSTVPVPPTNVTASVQSGGVLVTWTDQVNTLATGYTVERKVGTSAYTLLSEAPGPLTRSFVDTAPVAHAENCYVVYARGAAGPSGFSAPACVQVQATPVPPTPGTTPLACTGMMSEGGGVAVACIPQQEGRR